MTPKRAALAIVTVFWTVQFTGPKGSMTYTKGQEFLEHNGEVAEFVLRMPPATKRFECLSSWSGEWGTCQIIDLWVEEEFPQDGGRGEKGDQT